MGQRLPIGRSRQPRDLARLLIDIEEQRGAICLPQIFENAAWKLVLELYVAADAVPVSELALRVTLRPDSLERYLKGLEQAGVILVHGGGTGQEIVLTPATESHLDVLLGKAKDELLTAWS